MAPSQPILFPANGHYYELITAPLDWPQARAAAATRTYHGIKGHLLTITSKAENDFIVANFSESLREKHLGGELVNDRWTWITGEPFTFTNWAPGEPNGGLTGCMNFHGANALGTWNDVPTWQVLGYFVEYDAPLEYILSKNQVAGQNYVKGTVRIPSPAAAPVTIMLSDNSSLVSTPTSATIPKGALEKSFQISTIAVNSTIVTTLKAKMGTLEHLVTLTLVPLVPSAMAFTPKTVTGGNSLSCRLVINGLAGPSGRSISIYDNSHYSTVPSSVTVPPGGYQVIFSINTLPVLTSQIVTVTAVVSAGSKSDTFQIDP